MPDKPTWYAQIPAALSELSAMAFNRPVTASELELALRVNLRTAQTILKPFVTEKLGRAAAAKRAVVVQHLRDLAGTDAAKQAQEEFEHFRGVLAQLEADRKRNPPLLVEAPTEIQRSRWDDLDGVTLEPGRIVFEGFSDLEEAKRMLLKFIMAVANDQAGFEERIAPELAMRVGG